MSEVPIYFFSGFMDSGKTTLISETLINDGFGDDLDSGLIIRCEDGDEEYDEKKLERVHTKVVTIEKKENFTRENLQKLEDSYQPDAVFIEWNGTWETDQLYDDSESGFQWPEGWMIVQSLATVDAGTFEMYLLNMRKMMLQQLSHAEVIIFNRCTKDTKKSKFRGAIKAFNRPAQIVYEREDGTIDNDPEELPFDITKDEIQITDSDYAIWFMDCMDHPEKYDGKTISFKALVYNPTEGKGKLKPGTFVPGRFAMTCCVEDIQFLGMKCKYKDSANIKHRSWIYLTARLKNEFAKEYRGKGPVLYPISIEPAEKPATKEEELVYFN
ncbi:MAG: GTP-binding protein [Lachnospiraceae bacterium]|nr:GTP-binding protein [Lachnospiraceae bacterium]